MRAVAEIWRTKWLWAEGVLYTVDPSLAWSAISRNKWMAIVSNHVSASLDKGREYINDYSSNVMTRWPTSNRSLTSRLHQPSPLQHHQVQPSICPHPSFSGPLPRTCRCSILPPQNLPNYTVYISSPSTQ